MISLQRKMNRISNTWRRSNRTTLNGLQQVEQEEEKSAPRFLRRFSIHQTSNQRNNNQNESTLDNQSTNAEIFQRRRTSQLRPDKVLYEFCLVAFWRVINTFDDNDNMPAQLRYDVIKTEKGGEYH